MPYDPTEPTPKDVIRGLAGDTAYVIADDPDGDNASNEILEDETYLAIMERWGVGSGAGEPMNTAGFYRAAAEIVRRVMKVLESNPTSFAVPGDLSVGWAASRIEGLKLTLKDMVSMAQTLEAADAESDLFGPVVTFRDGFLTGVGGVQW